MTATAPATVQGEVSNTRGQVAIGTNINQNAIFLTVHLASNDPAQLDAVAQQIRLDPLGGRVTDWDRDFPGLIGRKGDVDVARDVLAGRGSIAVFGEEGIGKSVLLRHVARRTGDGFGGGVALIHGAGQRWQDIGQQVVRAFFRSSIPIYLGPAELRAVLKDLDALLLIDDADAADGIDELHAIALNSSFVVASTSRALAGESRGMMLGGLDDAAVHGLIVRTLQNLGQGSDLDAEVTTRIGRRLAGHPGRIIRVVEDAARRGVGLTALAQELEGQGDVAGDPVARLDGTAAAIVEAVAALDGAPVGPEHVASVLPGVSTGDVDEL
ncbi:MAG TPA: hypothetical protein VFO05_17520, partial [Candidatus Limnocylindrales bacterium]|nr:hypothetical protein [Candidatus Limnocylindrales bacterium]